MTSVITIPHMPPIVLYINTTHAQIITPVENGIPKPASMVPHARSCATNIPRRLGTLLIHAQSLTHLLGP